MTFFYGAWFNEAPMPTLTYPVDPGFKTEGTSQQAAIKTKSRAATLREMAYAELARHPDGLTADQVAEAIGESILSIRPRITELYGRGEIRRTGDKRRNASGLEAWVFVVNREAAE